MRKKAPNYLRGSYTVEASVVVTMTVLILAALILCTFYIHDRAVLQAVVCEAASAGSSFATEEERKAAAQEVVGKLGEERFLGSRGLEGSAALGKREVTVLWSAVYPIPGFAAKYLAKGRLDVRKTWTCRIADPADAIRKIKGAGELLTGGDH